MELLAQEGEATPTTLARRLPVSRQAVSRHLGVLEQAGLVSTRRVGRETRCQLTPGPLGETLTWLESVAARWDRRLERLRRYLLEEPPPGEGRG